MRYSSIALVAALSTMSLDAAAQVGTGRYSPPSTGSVGPQRGVVRRDTSRAVRTPPGQATNAVPVAVKLVPAVVMSDGTIMADFGFGLEVVRRACASVQTGGKVFIGGGQVIGQQPLVQPAPAQATPSQQMSPGQRPLSRAAQGSCFTRDASGRVFITQ